MNKQYSKVTKKDNYKKKQYKNNIKEYNYKKKHYNNNNYKVYNKNKNIYYENTYEDEISYDRETVESLKGLSSTDCSFSQSSNSNSRKGSISEINNSGKNNYSLILIDESLSEKSKLVNIPKIDLSESELKSAYYKPKNYKENTVAKNENNNIIDKNENIVILEINIKISNNKSIYFKLRKYDDMFEIVKECCKKNNLNENYINFFVYTIIKALNSIYGIYNICLKEDEIKFLKEIKNKCSNI